MEERIENGISDPARRVKLKRRLNGFPFSSKSGNSYMEKFLKSPSPDHKEVHEIPVDSATYESSFEIAKISTMIPEEERDPKSICQSLSPPKEEENIQELFMDKLNEVPSGTRDSVVLQSDGDNVSDSGIEAYNIPSTLQVEDSEKEIAVDGGSKTDDSVDDYQSGDTASEVDNYTDALTTMDSEMDTDSDFKLKNDMRHLNGRRESRDLDANDVLLQAHSSDSQSMGNSSLSDDGNSSSKKEISSFSYSDTHSNAADNAPSDEVSCNVFPSVEIHETEIIESSMDLQPINEEHTWLHGPGSAVFYGLSTEAAQISSHSSELCDQTASLSPTVSNPTYRSTEAFTKDSPVILTEADNIVTDPSLDISHIPSISKATEEKDYDSPQRLYGDNQLMDESEQGHKDTSEIVPETSCLSVSSHSNDCFQLHVSAGNQLVSELSEEDVNPNEYVVSATDQDLKEDDSPPQIIHEKSSLLSTYDQPLDEMHAEDRTLSENALASDLSVSPLQFTDCLHVAMSADSLPVKEMFNEDQNSNADGSSDVAAEEKSDQRSLDSVPESGIEEDLPIPNSDDNQIGEQNPDMPSADAHLGQAHCLDTDIGDTVSKVDDVCQSAREIPDNVTLKEDTHSELVEHLVSKTIAGALPIKLSEEQTSSSREEHFGDILDTGDGAELSEAASNTTMIERGSSVEPLLLAENYLDLDRVDTDSVNATAENNAIDDEEGPSGDVRTLQEVYLSGSEGEVKGLITQEPCLSERPEESSATEGLHQQIFSLLGSNPDSCQVVDKEQPVSETRVVNDVSATCLPLEATTHVDATTATAAKEKEIESSHTEEKVESLTKQLDQPYVLEANSEVVINLDHTQYQKDVDHVVPVCTSVPLDLPNEPPAAPLSFEFSNSSNTSGYPIYPSNSILSSFPLLPNASEIHVDDMPPMPPLPPVQWRMTRSQHALPGQVCVQNSASAFPPIFPSKADQDTQPVNQLLPQLAFADENSHPVSEQPIGKAVHLDPFISKVPSLVDHGDSKDNILPQGEIQQSGISQSSGSDGEMLQSSFQCEERENEKPRWESSSNLSPTDISSPCALELSSEKFTESLNQGAPETSLNEEELVQSSTISGENVVACDTMVPLKTEHEQSEQTPAGSVCAFGLSNEKLIRPLDQVGSETNIKEKELGNGTGHLEENLGSFDNNPLSAKILTDQPQHAISTSEATLAWPVGEQNKPNGLPPKKLPRPRSPLIDAVAAHDKSKVLIYLLLLCLPYCVHFLNFIYSAAKESNGAS